MKSKISDRTKILIGLTPLLIILAVSLANGTHASMSKVGFDPSINPMFDAAADYESHCTKCHGPDGKSNTVKGRKTHSPDLTKSTVSDTKATRLITNGRDEMPAFKNDLTPEQIAALLEYIKAFRK